MYPRGDGRPIPTTTAFCNIWGQRKTKRLYTQLNERA